LLHKTCWFEEFGSFVIDGVTLYFVFYVGFGWNEP